METGAKGPTHLHRRFFRLSALNILSNVTVPLVGLVDTAMLGHLADIRFLAGVALGAILFEYVYWTFGFLRMGTTGTTAQAVGQGDREQVPSLPPGFPALSPYIFSNLSYSDRSRKMAGKGPKWPQKSPNSRQIRTKG